MRRISLSRLGMDECGVILAALWEWQRDSDPVAEELHDRLADCAEIFLAEYEDADNSSAKQ